jgi:ZZ-type zinc finger-containing protein 3
LLKKLPDIDWTQYQEFMPESNRPFTRKKKEIILQPKIEPGCSSTFDDISSMKIRGKIYNDEKPETFNQLWTPAEQKRLEELLEEFPPEEIESRRWEKIATALGLFTRCNF